MDKAIFVQARIQSTRLRNKALMEINGITLTELVLNNLKRVEADLYLLLTDKESAVYLSNIAKKCGFEIFIGPQNNVLERFSLAIKQYQPKFILRATADNPLVSKTLVDLTYEKGIANDADYCLVKNIPIGSSVEFIKSSSLLKAYNSDTSLYEQEHVAPYLYNNKDKFKILYLEPPALYNSNISVTVDTNDDFLRIKNIYEKFYPKIPTLSDILRSNL